MRHEAALRRRIADLEQEVASLKAFVDAPYRAIVEDMSELVVRWKPDGTRLFVNDAYCRLFKASREDLIGTSFWPLISEEDRARVRARIAQLSPEEPVTRGRHRAYGPNGEPIWMEWVDRALFDGEGRVIELQSVGRDITDRVRSEEDARRVENADAVARLSAAIAHDLNNVLTVVGAVLEELRSEIGETEALEVLRESVQSIVRLVYQLKGNRLGAVLKPEPVDVNARVRKLQALLTEVSGDRVLLETRLSAEPCLILGDPTQVDQVLLNLVKNAADVMPHGGEIVITTRIGPGGAKSGDGGGATDDGHAAVLEVSDTGTGISDALLPLVFEPYVTSKPNGQGLGLATVKAIVDGHRGRVNIRTSRQGTTFEIAFPLAPR